MMDCLVIGDSIGVGVSQYRTDCISLVKGGINTWQSNKMYIDRSFIRDVNYNSVIISLGSNDHNGVNTEKELKKLRDAIKTKQVYWIMPAIKPNIQDIVLKMARQYGDKIVYIKDLSKDGIHPSTKGYKQLAVETQ